MEANLKMSRFLKNKIARKTALRVVVAILLLTIIICGLLILGPLKGIRLNLGGATLELFILLIAGIIILYFIMFLIFIF